MKLLMKFLKGETVLTSYEKELEKPEDFRAANDEAFDKFDTENPGVSIMDGITVSYDKAD